MLKTFISFVVALAFCGSGIGRLMAAPVSAHSVTQAPSGLPPLTEAVRRGDFKRVRFLLDHGAAINAQDKNGRTPLLDIAQQGNLKMMTLLVSKGANVNIQDKQGDTALNLVLSGPVSEGDARVPENIQLQEVHLLLSHATDVNAQDKDGDTALIMAMIEEPFTLAALLVAHGADVNAKDSDGVTPLMMAAAFYEGQSAYSGQGARNLQLLLTHGAEVNARDTHGATALFYGATDQYGTMTVWDVYWSDSEGMKSVKDILREMPGQSEVEEVEMARFLLNHGADVNVRDQDGRTVLSYAKSENHSDLVAELEKAGAKE